VAKVSFEENRYFFKQEEIEKYIADYLRTLPHAQIDSLQRDSRAVLKSIVVQHGLLMERAPEIYSFSHLTFQEYFTAKWFCDRADWQGLVPHIAEVRWTEVFLLTVNMMQNPEYFLQVMKQYADQLLASCEKSQQFINWVAQKASAAKTEDKVPYKLITIKAFYLTSAVENNGRLIHGGLAAVIDSDYRKVVFDFNTPNRHSAISPKLALDSYLNNAIANEFEFTLFAQDFDRALALDIDQKFRESLQVIVRQLKDELPDPETVVSDGNVCCDVTKVSHWWTANRRNWIDKIKSLVRHYRNIGHDWQFSEEQKELLQKYYDANGLLVKCLNSGCEVSKAVKEEIEETLLLPITEIEKRQQQM
jgi:predicted NACHT family NTPase